MTRTYFADSYALIEILRGNPSYQKYADADLLVCDFNIAEIYYYLLRTKGTEAADAFLKYPFVRTAVTITSLRAGMKFRLIFKKQDLSYADCIGYAIAIEKGIPFLTGDQQFKDKPNVEWMQ